MYSIVPVCPVRSLLPLNISSDVPKSEIIALGLNCGRWAWQVKKSDIALTSICLLPNVEGHLSISNRDAIWNLHAGDTLAFHHQHLVRSYINTTYQES